MQPSRRGAAVLASTLPLVLAAVGTAAPVPALDSAPPAAAFPLPAVITPSVAPPHIAFTDDDDELAHEVSYSCSSANEWGCDGDPEQLATGATHTGEASWSSQDLVYVSTHEQANGEIYLRSRTGEEPGRLPSGAVQRVTCNSAVETHPVVSPDRTKIAYASNESGEFHIWVAWLYPEDEVGSPVSCTDLPRVQVSHGPGEGLWPTWLGDDVVAYSSTRALATDEAPSGLGDLYAAPLGDRGEAVPDSAAVRLTDGPAAETQPRGIQTGEGEWGVIFTTTLYRPDGSLGVIEGLSAEELGVREVSSMWGDADPVQSSEAAHIAVYGDVVGFTSTRDDPYGDVLQVNLNAEVPEGESRLRASPENITPISAEPGRAESHVAFAADESGVEALYTRRTHLADVTAVVAADGSDRRAVSQWVGVDNATPTYSPDGTLVAFSRTSGSGKEIVIGPADGSGLWKLFPDTAGRDPATLDLEPVWSPDGTRIAFVRYLAAEEGPGISQVAVATVATGEVEILTPDSPDAEYWDESPSWSPDGTRVVIGRAVITLPDVTVEFDPVPPASVVAGSEFPLTVTVTNNGGRTDGGVRLRFTADGDPQGLPRLTFDAPSPSCFGFSVMDCSLGDLAPGASTTITLTATATAVGPGEIRAEVDTFRDNDPADNVASAPLAVTDPPEVAVALDLPGELALGGDNTAVVTVTNAENAGPAPPFAIEFETSEGSGGGQVQFDPSQPAGCTRGTVSTAQCQVTGLAPGAQVSFELPISGAASGQAFVEATVDPLPGETVTDNNSDFVDTFVFSDSSAVEPTEPTPEPSETPGLASWGGTRMSPVAYVTPASSPVVAAPRVIRDLDATPGVSGIPTELWVIDATTGEGSALEVEGRVPAWSPDGLTIAYEAAGDVWIHTLAGGTNAAVTGFDADGEPTPARSVLSAATDPAWSPDGSELAVAGQPAGQPDQRGIYVLRADGTGLRVVTQERGQETEPAWQAYSDVTVTVTADPEAVVPGATTELTATVTNNGPGDTAELTLLIELPEGLTPGEPPDGCTLEETVYTCVIEALESGGTTTVTVTAVGEVVEVHAVTAVVNTPGPDVDPENNIATTTVTVSETLADLAVTLSAAPDDTPQGAETLLEATVTNNGPQPAELTTLRIQLDAGLAPGTALPSGCLVTGLSLACELGSIAPGESVTITWAVTGSVAGTQTATAEVGSSVPDPDSANDRATVRITVVAAQADISVTITTPARAWVGQHDGVGTTVLIHNAGPQPAEVTLLVTPEGLEPASPGSCISSNEPCSLGTFYPGTTMTLNEGRFFLTAGSGTVTATVSSTTTDPVPANNTASASTVVLQPKLRLSPNVVTPGHVTVVSGTDFPPGVQVQLAYDVGITERRAPVRVQPDGTIAPQQMVVLRRDRLGPRKVVATDPELLYFSPVDADLLVAPRSVSPPGFVERN